MLRLSEQSKKDLEKLRMELGDVSFPSKGWKIYSREMNRLTIRDIQIWKLLLLLVFVCVAGHDLFRWYTESKIWYCERFRDICFDVTHQSRPKFFDFLVALDLFGFFGFGSLIILSVYYKLTMRK
jgi:hypothetical protein